MRFFRTSSLGFTTLAVSYIKTRGETKDKYTYCDKLISPKFSSFTYNANSPSEDRFSIQQNNDWNIVGVFDGHGGWQVAEFVQNNLISKLSSSIALVPANDNNSVENLIKDAFSSTEKLYIEKIKPAYDLGFGGVASVGSCVIVAAQKDSTLVIGNCGDCRAVLGSTSSSTSNSKKFLSTRLTNDHNARVASEDALLRKAHPGENDIVLCKDVSACYVKGRLQLTRALGDLYLKYPAFNAPPNCHRSRGRHVPPPYTPPYVGSEPDVFHIELTARDRFVILASDGLWDFLSDEEAVEIVAKCSDPSHAAEDLVNTALVVAASSCGLSVKELLALPAGSQRRSRHDDTTVIVIHF